MSGKGRHAGNVGSFYRDLVIMVLGILGVGALVFFLMFLLARDTASETTTSTTTASTSSSSTLAQTSTTAGTTSTAPSTTTTTTVPVRPNEDVRVVVLNSVGIGGAAGRLTQIIADAGYQTLEAADYRPEQDPSKVWFREGFSAEANTLADFLIAENGSEFMVEALEDVTLQPGADVIVVLGTGYSE